MLTRVKDVVDQLEDMRALPRRTRHNTIAMTMGSHERCKDMSIPRGEAMDILRVKALPLQTVVEEGFIRLEMLGLRSIHHLDFTEALAEAQGFQLGLHFMIAPYDNSLSETLALILNRGAKHAGIID